MLSFVITLSAESHQGKEMYEVGYEKVYMDYKNSTEITRK